METLGTQVILRDDRTHVAVHESIVRVVAGPDAGRTVKCTTPRVSIGTAPNNDLVLGDDTVSSHHAQIVRKGERFVVRDLGSTNGTWVGDEEVVEAFLSPGKRIHFGNTTIELTAKVEWLPVERDREDFGELVGRSEVMRTMFGLLERVARTELVCVVLGETGVGKEMVARAIHGASPRREQPFVVVDCASVNRQLIESDLFGHERGAFTGAEQRRAGAFELASGGTLFLDEVGELPLDLQPRLLRVLERREVRPLGAERTLDVDVRVVAATHRDLEAQVAEGTFREDLFYRLAEIVLHIPPLHARKEDIPLLAKALLPRNRVSSDAEAKLAALDYPGNVRELRNLLRRAAALADRGVIDAAAIEQALLVGARRPPVAAPTPEDVPLHAELSIKDARQQWLDVLEPRYLRAVLDRVAQDLDAAAAHAGIHKKTFARTLRKHGVEIDD